MKTKIYFSSPAAACAVWRLLFAALVFLGVSAAAAATTTEDKAQTVVHMLDYVSVDYPEFVKDGKVLNEEEYREQREFATQAIALLEQLPEVEGNLRCWARRGSC